MMRSGASGKKTTTEIPDAYAKLIILATLKLPTVSDFLSNFVAAMSRILHFGFQPVSQKTYTKRLLICRECYFWNEKFLGGRGRCNQCIGPVDLQNIGARLWLAEEVCPLDKWKKNGRAAPKS